MNMEGFGLFVACWSGAATEASGTCRGLQVRLVPVLGEEGDGVLAQKVC